MINSIFELLTSQELREKGALSHFFDVLRTILTLWARRRWKVLLRLVHGVSRPTTGDFYLFLTLTTLLLCFYLGSFSGHCRSRYFCLRRFLSGQYFSPGSAVDSSGDWLRLLRTQNFLFFGYGLFLGFGFRVLQFSFEHIGRQHLPKISDWSSHVW